MGWLWTSNGDGKDIVENDPVKSLDNDLKEYLKQASSDRYRPGESSDGELLSTNAPDAERALVSGPELVTTVSQEQRGQSASQRPSGAPRESLYSDGRYADLWKTYESYNSISDKFATDQDRLRAIVEQHSDRRHEIGRTALENCANEQIEVQDCYKYGTWWDIMSICKKENRAANRCYEMQAKFLRALGYLSMPGRSPEIEERIQMHADKLYHSMLEHERLTAESKEKGLPPPDLKPIMSRENIAKIVNLTKTAKLASPTDGSATQAEKGSAADTERIETAILIEDLPEKTRTDLHKRLQGLTLEERALELRVFESDHELAKNSSKDILKILEHEKASRLDRRRRGTETVGDKMKRWWGGWD